MKSPLKSPYLLPTFIMIIVVGGPLPLLMGGLTGTGSTTFVNTTSGISGSGFTTGTAPSDGASRVNSLYDGAKAGADGENKTYHEGLYNGGGTSPTYMEQMALQQAEQQGANTAVIPTIPTTPSATAFVNKTPQTPSTNPKPSCLGAGGQPQPNGEGQPTVPGLGC